MNNIGSKSTTDETKARNPQNASYVHTNLTTERWSCLRRYVIALLLCILFLIQVSRHVNASFTRAPLVIEGNSSKVKYFYIGDYVHGENLDHIMEFLIIFTALVGALVIYKVSCRKFILAAVIISSILHMLIPAAPIQRSVYYLLTVLSGHNIISVPTLIAALSIWKDWAPPEERMRLVTISLCAMILTGTGSILDLLLFPYAGENLYYLLGAAGIIWVLIWYNITADTPKNDPLISEKEHFYLESKIPRKYTQENITFKAIPWMMILKCKQMYILSVVFFKLAFSVETIQVVAVIYHHTSLKTNPLALTIPLICVLAATLIGVSVTMDFLINHYKNNNLKIRKYFICGGYLLQCIFMVGAVITTLEFVKKIYFILAFSAFAFSVPGCLTYPLDLSPRYAPLTAGIAFAFFCIGIRSFDYVFKAFNERFWMDPIPWLYLIDGTISLATAIIFGIWADVQEQQWSRVLSSRHSSHGYKSYPKPDEEEDLNLAPVHV